MSSSEAPQTTDEKSLQVGECSCKGCQNACRHRPGFFRPEQIEPLAQAMGLTTEQLFKEHLQVDWWIGDPDVFLLAPKLSGEEGGSMYPTDPRGACHWFENGKCAVHALGKPAECQGLGHVDGKTVTADREQIVEAWRAHQGMVSKLYGCELVAPETSIFDMIGMLSHV